MKDKSMHKNVVLLTIPACWRCGALPGWQLGRPQQNPAKNDAEKDGVTYVLRIRDSTYVIMVY